MSTIMSAVRRFIADEDGVTALEYGMIAALIAAVIVGAVKTLGGDIKGTFGTIADALTAP